MMTGLNTAQLEKVPFLIVLFCSRVPLQVPSPGLDYVRVPTELWKSRKNLENHQIKVHTWKNHGMSKNLNNHGKSWNFVK